MTDKWDEDEEDEKDKMQYVVIAFICLALIGATVAFFFEMHNRISWHDEEKGIVRYHNEFYRMEPMEIAPSGQDK